MRLRDRQREQRERTLARRRARRAQVGTQLELPVRRQKKMGRPRKHDPGVAHVRRPAHLARLPLHVTLRVEPRVWNLRSRRSFKVIEKAFWGAMARSSARICHFSIMGNHIHLIIEAGNRSVLSAAMRSLGVRLGKGMNRVMSSRGRVVAQRYLARALCTPSQVARARRYVLYNFAQHAREWGERLPARFVDPYSSAALPDLPPPQTWLLDVGWQRAAA
jgi:putative transposase